VPSAHTAATVESLSVIGSTWHCGTRLWHLRAHSAWRLVCLRRTGIAALVVSISAGMTSNLLFLAAFRFRLDWFREPALILGSGAIRPSCCAGRQSWTCLSYYLATAVLAYVLWRQLRPRNPLVADLSTMAAVGYALAVGRARSSLPWSRRCWLMHSYTDATAAGQALIAVRTVLQVVWRCHLAIPGRHPFSSLVARNRAAPPPRSSPLILPVAGTGRGRSCWAVNVGGLSLVRDVLLGVLFTLWTAWWISAPGGVWAPIGSASAPLVVSYSCLGANASLLTAIIMLFA